MSKPVIHLICNAHLDPVWQWRWEEGCSEALSTFRTAVEILHEHDQLIFNHNEAVLYRWVHDYDPVLFRKIQELVTKGRWCISGGWYLQPDVNLPGTESIIRHIAEGRKFFRENFKVSPQVAYNFDSFGHSGGLPQILALAGYKMYIHMRPQKDELNLPADLYRWQGIDGSEILAYRISVGLYHTERDNIDERIIEATDQALSLNRDVPVFWGIGNHGGGPTREDLKKIDAFMHREKKVEIIHSTPERLYEALKAAAQNAPLVKGDLQRVFTGCYTSLSRIKRRAQQSLAELAQSETLRSATWWLYGHDYPQELEGAWRDHLFNDFHDILPGSCTQPAEQDALDQYGRVAETVRRLRMGAAVKFNEGPPRKTHVPVTVLNTNPSLVHVPVEVECMLDLRPKWKGLWHLKLVGMDGKEIPCQEEQPESLLPFNAWRRKVSFFAALPPIGSSSYKIEIAEGETKAAESKPALGHEVDTAKGLVRSLKAGHGVECLSGLLFEPLVVEDEADSWGTGWGNYRNVVGKFEARAPASVIQIGPVRTITESVLEYGHSSIVFHTIAYSAWPVLEFRLRVQWNEVRRRLKLSVPTVFNSSAVLCEVPGGAIDRPAGGQEHVHGRWLLLRGKLDGHDKALAVVNSGQNGFDFVDGEVRLSVLRSAAYCHEQGLKIGERPVRKYMDQGVHEFRLLLTAGEGTVVRNQVTAFADWLSAPPVVYSHLPSGGMEMQQSLFGVKPDTLRMLACKRSWDGGALVVRFQEMAGIETRAEVRLNVPHTVASVSFKPYEIKTLRFERSGAWHEVKLIEET